MFLTQHELCYRDAKEKEHAHFLSQPDRIEIQMNLNQLSTCVVSYSNRTESLALGGQGDKFTVPYEMRIEAKVVDDPSKSKQAKPFRLFNGFLNTVSMTQQGDSGLKLEYVDPMVTLLEKDDPVIWSSQERPKLQRIVDELMSNSFDRSSQTGSKGQRKTLKSHFLDAAPELSTSLVNLGQTDLSFIQELSSQFGFHFFFQHDYDSNSELRVVFFKPDFKRKDSTTMLDQGHLLGFAFRGGVNGFPDKVQVVHSSGTATATIKDIASDLSPAFRPKMEARSASGIEFVFNEHRPLMSAGEAQAFADGIVMNNALAKGDQLIFSSDLLLKVGSMIDLRKNDKIRPELPTRTLGKYLLADSNHSFSRNKWVHQYRAVRP